MASAIRIAHMIFPAEIHVTEQESRALAAALINTFQAFNVVPGPKTIALTALVGVAAGTYRPKLAAVAARARQARAAAREAANPGNFPGTPSQPWEGGQGVQGGAPPAPADQRPPSRVGDEIVLTTGVPISYGSDTVN